MFCPKCYTELPAAGVSECPKCRRPFNPANPNTYLDRPFPNRGQIVGQLIFTTAVGVAVAFGVAFFQMIGASGH